MYVNGYFHQSQNNLVVGVFVTSDFTRIKVFFNWSQIVSSCPPPLDILRAIEWRDQNHHARSCWS